MLDSLLLPGTPEPISKRYHTLEERAGRTDFGPLDEVVVLDTETTGLSFRDCELIEIAAARMSGGEVVERFRTFVHPGQPIPGEIQRLTHITDLDVAGAPSAEEAVAQLADFVGGEPILAHNATFDRTFVEKVPGGQGVSEFWIDTLSLSRIALPRLRSHRLADMAKAFHCDSVTHRAMDDVDALCGMWRIILCALSDLPGGVLSTLADMHPEASWSFRPVLSYLASCVDDESAPLDLKAIRRELVSEAKGRPRPDAREVKLSAVPSDVIRDSFGPEGLVSHMYQHYEKRPEQVSMALEVADALSTSTHRAIEAGTGVGKSIAYLLPEVLYAQQNGITIGIATKTNALTDQLVSHELPALSDEIPGGIRFFALKGYDHYPCLMRLENAVAGELPTEQMSLTGKSRATVEQDMLTAIAVTLSYASQSPLGDLDALGIRWKNVPRDMLTISSADCLRGRCPYYPNECFVHGARRMAASGDVVVTNHSLLLRDISSGNAILPPIRHWVIDEAHGFESEARRQWALEVSGEQSKALFEALGGTRSGLLHALTINAGRGEAATLHVGLLTKAAAAVSRASISMGDFLDALHGLLPLAGKGGGYDGVNVWIDAKVRGSKQWGDLSDTGNTCVHRLDDAVHFLEDANTSLAEGSVPMAGELGEAIRRLGEMRDTMRLVLDGTDESYVYSVWLYRQTKHRPREKLVAEKVDIGNELGTRWLPEMMSVVYTSGTIAVGSSFEHFDHAVGLDSLPKETYKNVKLSSSYDLNQNMAVVVAKDLPQAGESGYVKSLSDFLYDVHVAMDGSVLTLFTNRREMEQVYEMLAPRLKAQGLDLACQERNSSARRLGERFVSDKHLSLLALRSFWEGFDAAGDTLRCVVIPKLPFANPHDPLVRERDQREQRAWWKYSLPEAIISVKQAAGRLIRSSDDKGVVILADSRIANKRYGKQVVNSMPSDNSVFLDAANVGRYLKMWRKSHER